MKVYVKLDENGFVEYYNSASFEDGVEATVPQTFFEEPSLYKLENGELKKDTSEENRFIEEQRMQEEVKQEKEKQAEIINEFVIEQVTKMIEADELSEDEKKRFLNVYPPFTPNTDYKVGEKVRYRGSVYEVIQAHTSQADWMPPDVPALFNLYLQETVTDPETGEEVEVIHDWKQPLGGHDAYKVGDKVKHKGKVWESVADNNAWQPGVYGWKEVEHA